MDMEKLAAEAAVAAVKELVKAGIEGGVAAGGTLWTWLRGKAPAGDASTIAAIEAHPNKPSTETKVKGLLLDLLDGNPGLQEELNEMLKENNPNAPISMTMEISGKGNKAAQMAGEHIKSDIK